jgi:hypothetical protein
MLFSFMLDFLDIWAREIKHHFRRGFDARVRFSINSLGNVRFSRTGRPFGALAYQDQIKQQPPAGKIRE